MERFQIIKTLGDGSYGAVYKAIDKTNNEIVAIKRMKDKYRSWDDCMNLNEIKALKKLSHVNIVKLKEVLRVNEELFLVFEFLDRNVYQFMKSRENLFNETEIRKALYQVFQGLAYMHKHGFFHRDLKPENLLVSETEEIKIADFGLAREIRSSPPFTEYISTRWYRAPECILFSNNYNSPVDMFAMGCIMAEFYLGKPLGPGSSNQDQMYRLCQVLGTPTAASWPEGFKQAAKIGYQFPQTKAAMPLHLQIPNASHEAIKLMIDLLQFDPAKRPNAVTVLQYPYFSKHFAIASPTLERRITNSNVGAMLSPRRPTMVNELQLLSVRNSSAAALLAISGVVNAKPEISVKPSGGGEGSVSPSKKSLLVKSKTIISEDEIKEDTAEQLIEKYPLRKGSPYRAKTLNTGNDQAGQTTLVKPFDGSFTNGTGSNKSSDKQVGVFPSSKSNNEVALKGISNVPSVGMYDSPTPSILSSSKSTLSFAGLSMIPTDHKRFSTIKDSLTSYTQSYMDNSPSIEKRNTNFFTNQSSIYPARAYEPKTYEPKIYEPKPVRIIGSSLASEQLGSILSGRRSTTMVDSRTNKDETAFDRYLY